MYDLLRKDAIPAQIKEIRRLQREVDSIPASHLSYTDSHEIRMFLEDIIDELEKKLAEWEEEQ